MKRCAMNEWTTGGEAGLDLLRRAVAAGEAPAYLFFWGHTPARAGVVDKACLSQWYPAPFTVDDVTYPTAEHYMMAEKARLSGDEETRSQILASTDPREAKALGRKVRGFDAAVWERERFGVVVRGNEAKFSADPALRAFLLDTAPRVLVEASPVDPIWGIGLAADDPAAQDPARWRGLNLLGFALMEARGRL